MDKNKTYYENWLNYIETIQLEAVGDLLNVEMAIFEARKIIRLSRELNEYDNLAFDKVKVLLTELKSKQKILAEAIDSHELDITHCRFMIELLSRPTNDDE